MPPELENAETDTLDVTAILDAADAPEGAEQSAKAESSDAEDVSKPSEPDSLSIVRDVLAKSRETASSAESEEVAGPKTDPAAPKEPDNETYSDVPFHKHPRFQEVVGKLKTAELDATRYQNVQRFIDEQGLAAEEAADLLVIGGLIKTNPAEAWKRMQPVVQKVLLAAGEVLPDDLKAQVQSQEMSREAALELSRVRAKLQSVEARTSFDQQRAQARQQAEAVSAVQQTVSSWEAERRLRDPNFDAKMPALQREIAWLQTNEGRPNTPEGARAQLQKAYDAVAPIAQPTIVKPAVRPVTGGQVSGNVQPEVKNTMDVVQRVMARRAG